MPGEIRGNHAVEAPAIRWVLANEREQGREARDARHQGEPDSVTISS